MKKLSIIVAVITLVLMTYSCNTSQNDEGTLDETQTATETENLQKAAEKNAGDAFLGKVVHLSTPEFKQKVFNYDINRNWKYEGSKPCIVDFYADWCGPCKRIAPILDQLAKEYKGQIVIYKIDTEKERELASAFGIQSIPSLLFIPVNGKAEMIKGALPKEKFKEAIDVILLKKNQ